MKKTQTIILLAITVLMFISCTAGPNIMKGLENSSRESAGFLLGLWHGFISLFTFIISLFNDKVNVYEIYNNGGLYNLGFIIGISAFYGGGTKGAGCKRK